MVCSFKDLFRSNWHSANCLAIHSSATEDLETYLGPERYRLPLRLFTPVGRIAEFSLALERQEIQQLEVALQEKDISHEGVVSILIDLMSRWAANNLLPSGTGKRTVLVFGCPEDVVKRVNEESWHESVDRHISFQCLPRNSQESDPLGQFDNNLDALHVYDEHGSLGKVHYKEINAGRLKGLASYQSFGTFSLAAQAIDQLNDWSTRLAVVTLLEGALPAVVVADERLSKSDHEKLLESCITISGENAAAVKTSLSTYKNRYVTILAAHIGLFEKENNENGLGMNQLVQEFRESGAALVVVISDRSHMTIEPKDIPGEVLFVPSIIVRQAVEEISKVDLVHVLINAKSFKWGMVPK